MYDVIIIGTGPAAYVGARTLRQAGAKVAILGARHKTKPNRLETLNYKAISLVSKFGLRDALESARQTTNNQTATFWGSKVADYSSPIELLGGVPIIEKIKFAESLFEHDDNLFIGYPTATKKTSSGFEALVSISGKNKKISSDFLLDATGYSGGLYKHFNIKKIVFDKMICITFSFGLDSWRDRNLTSIVETIPFGWCFAIKGHSEVQLSLYTDSQNLKILRGNSTNLLKILGDIQSNSSNILPIDLATINTPSDASVFPSSTMALNDICSGHYFVCGDAAQTYDPVSSMGIFRALESGFQTSQIMIDHANGKKSSSDELRRRRQLSFVKYLEKRFKLYSREKQWPRSRFWEARSDKNRLLEQIGLFA